MTTEADAIARSERPVTVESLVADLRSLGVLGGGVVIVHSSLSALGWVAGGAQAVVEALLTTVGPDGTVVMPTQSGQLSDPAGWANPPVPPDWVASVRDGLPAYDPDLTPSRSMGAVVECFRALPQTMRSDHPLVSFAANGPHAQRIVAAHALAPQLGETSPLGRLEQLDAQVVLLGVDHGSNTALHLAEYRATWPGKSITTQGAPIRVDGAREWVTFEDLDIDEEDFAAIGTAFAATGGERTGPVGAGTGRLVEMRSMIEFAVDWMTTHRN